MRTGSGSGWGDVGLLPWGSGLSISLNWGELSDSTQMFFSNSGIDIISSDYSELLPEITLIASKSGRLSDNAGSQIQDHVYRNSGAYQSFYGCPIRIVPDLEVASYFVGAINIPEKNWMGYLNNGLNSRDGRLMMHEYGHFLQNKSGGSIWYNSYPASSSVFDNLISTSQEHHKHWAEIQASTLAYYYFGFPTSFTTYNIVDPSYISAKQQSALFNQYLKF